MTTYFGSIISGTMREEDLIPAFADILRSLAPDDVSAQALCAEADAVADFTSEDAYYVLEALFDELDALAPAYGYFGAHPSDGADYGFWLNEDWEQVARDDGALFVDDTSEVPADYSGEVVHANDHGNVTLYACTDGELSEVWAVV